MRLFHFFNLIKKIFLICEHLLIYFEKSLKIFIILMNLFKRKL